MNADYRYVAVMEKYITIQQLNEKERGEELLSFNYITLISLLACGLIKCFSDYVKLEAQDELQEIEIVHELKEKNIIPFKGIHPSIKIFDFNISEDNIFDYLKCYYNNNKNEFYTTDYYDEISEIRVLQVENTNSFNCDNQIVIIDGYYINELFNNPDLKISSLGSNSKTDIVRLLELIMKK
jgi:hypothetical protein